MSGKRGTRKLPGRVTWWLLIAVSGGALAFIFAVVHAGLVLECLRDWTDQDRVHPGLLRVYAPTDDRRDN